MKNPSVPSRCGSVWANIGTPGCCQTGRSERRSSAAEVRVLGEEGLHHALVLDRRDRARRVDQRAAGPQRLRPRAQDRALQRARAARAARRACASARPGARRASRGPSTAGRPARGRRPAAPARRRRRRCAPRRWSRPCARRCARAPARARVALDRDDAPRGRPSARPGGSSCRRARRTGRARARPARGASARETAIAARDCGMKRPCAHSGEPKASNGASSTSPSGSPGAGRLAHGQRGGQLGRRGAQRVGAQRGLGGPVAGRHQRARLGRRRARRTTAPRSTRDGSGAARPRRAWPRGARRRARAPRAPLAAARR